MKKSLLSAAVAAIAVSISFGADYPVDENIYDVYLKEKAAWNGNKKAEQKFFREAFAGGGFDVQDFFKFLEEGEKSGWDVKKVAKLEKCLRTARSHTGDSSGPGLRILALQRRLVEPIKKKNDIIVDGVHAYSTDDYVWPDDAAVREALERFRDRKLGLMMHFGIYSQLGVYESWPLVDKEAVWSRTQIDWHTDGDKFKAEYWRMMKSFNPVRFQPDVIADIAKRDGFKYLVFTTKHHDGFCMFDSKYSDYKVTNPECPYSLSEKPDIVKEIFNAFRNRGMTISCYFSKPDWHNEDYWENHGLGRFVDRNPTYDVEENPAKWARYQVFVKNQLLELVKDYGPLDQLWLDGGQVQRRKGLDIKIEEIITEARKITPGLISVDRCVGGFSENIITPEQTVPPVPMMVPWESCITMGTGFSYRYDDTFKSSKYLIQLLIDIVAKGGNLALNVAPGPDGRLPKPAIERMDAMGEWLRKNGAAIYSTRVLEPYRVSGKSGEWAFTQGKSGEKYAIRLWGDKERGFSKITLPKEWKGEVKCLVHLATGKTIKPGECVYADDAADAFLVK